MKPEKKRKERKKRWWLAFWCSANVMVSGIDKCKYRMSFQASSVTLSTPRCFPSSGGRDGYLLCRSSSKTTRHWTISCQYSYFFCDPYEPFIVYILLSLPTGSTRQRREWQRQAELMALQLGAPRGDLKRYSTKISWAPQNVRRKTKPNCTVRAFLVKSTWISESLREFRWRYTRFLWKSMSKISNERGATKSSSASVGMVDPYS